MLTNFSFIILANWQGEAKFNMHFTNGGAIEFGQAMLTAAKMGEL